MNFRIGLPIAVAILMLATASQAGRDENNALFSAVNRGDAAGVEKALKAGADPGARLMNGDTPLKIAERKGLADIAGMLTGGTTSAPAAPPAAESRPPAPQPPPAPVEAPPPPVVMPAPAPAPAAAAAPVPPEPPKASVPDAKPAAQAAVPIAGLQSLLDSKALAGEYNGVVVDFLVEEGKDRLSAGQRKEALDQLVTSLKEKARVSKDEQISMSLGALTGIAMGAARDDIVADAGADVESSYAGDWDSWIDAAFQLVHAGYAQDAADFFEFGMKHIPYPDLQGRCVKGLALARPDSAYDFLMATLNTRDTEKINPALRLLGFLASDPALPKDKHDAIVDKLIEFTQGILHTDSFGDAIFALDVAGDPRAVPALSRLKKGMAVGSEVKRAALRSLLLTYKDTSVIETLKGMTRGGLMTLNNPWDNFYAGSLLIEAGDEAGFAWAQKQLAQVRKSFLASDTDPELRPDIVRVLVKHGGKRGGKVLAETVDLYRDDQWLKTWIAVGMLELGDAGKIDLVRKSLENPEWDYTAVRIVEALAKNGDLSGLPVLEVLIGKRPPQRSAGVQLLSALAGRKDDTKDEKRRLADLRIQIANALARIDKPGCVPRLRMLLRDENVYARSAAAVALTKMTIPGALDGLADAIAADYGTSDGRSRNPGIHAHVVRLAAMRFAADPRTADMLAAAAASSHPSVRFLALVLAGRGG